MCAHRYVPSSSCLLLHCYPLAASTHPYLTSEQDDLSRRFTFDLTTARVAVTCFTASVQAGVCSGVPKLIVQAYSTLPCAHQLAGAAACMPGPPAADWLPPLPTAAPKQGAERAISYRRGERWACRVGAVECVNESAIKAEGGTDLGSFMLQAGKLPGGTRRPVSMKCINKQSSGGPGTAATELRSGGAGGKNAPHVARWRWRRLCILPGAGTGSGPRWLRKDVGRSKIAKLSGTWIVKE